MPADFQAQHQRLLEHYTRLARTPGWKEYVHHQLRQMGKACPELFGDFHAQVDAALKSAAPPASPVPPPSSSLTATPRAASPTGPCRS